MYTASAFSGQVLIRPGSAELQNHAAFIVGCNATYACVDTKPVVQTDSSRKFYTSLLKQRPESEMAKRWYAALHGSSGKGAG